MPNIVKYLIDHYQVKFFLTGSASFYLKNLFSESLAGRKYIFELFPLSFKEFLLLKGERICPPAPGERVLEAQYALLMRYYREYFEYGGFPQVIAKTSAEDKKRSFDDIFSSYFQLEVERLGDFRKVHVVRDLILLLAARSGSMLDVSKLSSELGVSRPTIYEYLSFLEGTYFIHIVRPWSKSRDVAIRKAVKLYVCDAGLARHLGGASEGTLFETNVFQQLRLQGEICYYRKKSGAAIDFIVNKDTAHEAKMKATEHEVKRLAILSKELGLKQQSVVSYAYGEKGNVLYPFQLSAE